ncbi:MAG: hypothetical protein Q8O43_00155 [Dehalococcoidia bacterium]|nr:hypothetical protein [Dehalococcoidia bacterium]
MYLVLTLISSVVSLIFAVLVFIQFLTHKKPYQLIWAIGIIMYGIGTGAEFWTESYGLNETVYRLWYLFGAILVSAYLGMGTVYLLVKRPVAHIVMVLLGVASIYAVYRVYNAPVDLGIISQLSGKALPGGIRMLTPFYNSFGTLALVGGALYSAWVFWRRKIMPHRVVSNILIAFGAILPAIGGTQLKLGGQLGLFYTLELAGIVIIFIGFLRSSEVFGLGWLPPKPPAAQAQGK